MLPFINRTMITAHEALPKNIKVEQINSCGDFARAFFIAQMTPASNVGFGYALLVFFLI